MRFIDTNIIVYSATQNARSELARDILLDGGRIAVQTLTEFANVCRRKLGHDWQQVRASIDSVVQTCIVATPLSEHDVERGFEIAERYGLSVYDSMLISVALRDRCDEFLSEDLHDGLVIDGRLTVRNPFAEA